MNSVTKLYVGTSKCGGAVGVSGSHWCNITHYRRGNGIIFEEKLICREMWGYCNGTHPGMMKDFLHISSFAPVSERLTSKSFHGSPSVKSVSDWHIFAGIDQRITWIAILCLHKNLHCKCDSRNTDRFPLRFFWHFRTNNIGKCWCQ